MKELCQVLSEATGLIEGRYFHLAVYGSGRPIYRERVYCYELYHQMRKRWPSNCPYYLNGEVDKRSHPTLSELGVGGIPDFLVHQPGNMSGNYAIIEVKNACAKSFGNDLQKLSIFFAKAEYRRAIYLVYGDEADDRLVNKIIRCARKIPNLAPIELWVHREVGKPAVQRDTLPLVEITQTV
jgi:hypothetical protein